jgi:GNAT superfamily N-acetyltransferase
VETFPEAETPGVLRTQVREMQDQAWPSTEPGSPLDLGPVHDPALRPLSMLLVEEGSVLSALDVLFKQIVHAGQELSAAGLSTVVTPRAHRGRGYGRTLVTWAREALPALDVDLGLFTCDRSLGAFYEECGWEILHGTVLVGGTPDQPFPSDQPGFAKVTLGAFFTPTAIQARESMLDARVMLHCGVIDKLW